MRYLLRGSVWLLFFVLLSLVTTWAFKYLPGVSLLLLVSMTLGTWWQSERQVLPEQRPET